MRLSSLLSLLPPDQVTSAPTGDPVIRGLCYDSRGVAAGDLFFALRGTAHDGHDYLTQALDLGAAAVAVERIPEGVELRGRPAVVLRDSRRALAPVSRRFYGDPASELSLIGVTGTNGKTSVTYLVESILQRTLRAMRTQDVEAVVMEVSSHGLELGRVLPVRGGSLHQPHPGPPRLPRDDARLSRRQDASLPAPPGGRRAGRRQRR
jgi:UDP-N-acetylmuramyl tripeptide synthase